MEKIKFESVKIENFMCLKNELFELDDKVNVFRGYNGTGKTTVLSAIYWCLSGKNFNDEKNFNNLPLDENGEEIKEINCIVEIKLNHNGVVYTITRKSRYAKKTTMKKDVTLMINETEFSQREYEVFLKEKLGFNLDEFKLLSNTNFAVNLDWQELKQLFSGILGSQIDEDILQKEDYKAIREKVLTVGYYKTKESIQDGIKIENEAKDKFAILINEKQNKVDELSSIVNSLEKLQERKVELEKQNDTYNEKVNIELNKNKLIIEQKNKLAEVVKKVQSQENKLNEIKEQGVSIKNRLDKDFDIETLSANVTKMEEVKLNGLNNELKFLYNDVLNIKNKIVEYQNEIVELNSKEIIVTEICSMCGSELSQEKIETSKKAMQDDINNKVAIIQSKIDKLMSDGAIAKEKFDNKKNEIKTSEEHIAKIKSGEYTVGIDMREKLELEKQRAKLLEEHGTQSAILEVLKKEVVAIEQAIEKMPQPQELVSPTEIKNELVDINSKLVSLDRYNELKEEIKQIAESSSNSDKKLKAYEVVKAILDKFNKERSEKINQELNKYFNYIQFILTETTKEGKEKETFKISHDGKTLKDLSSGETKRCAIDLTQGLQVLMGIQLPILVDQLGELSLVPTLDTQFIGCRTIEECQENDQAFSKLNFKKGNN